MTACEVTMNSKKPRQKLNTKELVEQAAEQLARLLIASIDEKLRREKGAPPNGR